MTKAPSPSASGSPTNPSESPLVEVDGLSFGYAGRAVIRDLAFSLPDNSVTAFVGRNGEGKSTTLRLLAGLLRPWQGMVRVLGGNPMQDARSRGAVGYLPERPPLYPQVDCEQHLRLAAALHGLAGEHRQEAVEAVLARCELESVRRRPAARLSKGFQQRLGLAMAIVHRPRVVLLDEPGSGLDPVQQRLLRDRIEELTADAAVLYSTHMLNEALAVADRLLVLSGGSLVYQGARAALDESPGDAERLLLDLMSGLVPA